MLVTKLEVEFCGSKNRSKDRPSGYWARPGNPTSLRIVFDISGYLMGCWIEVAENEILYFNETYTVVAYFMLITPEAWELIKDKIHIGMSMNAHAGSEIIGKAKLLEYKYYRSHEFVGGELILNE